MSVWNLKMPVAPCAKRSGGKKGFGYFKRMLFRPQIGTYSSQTNDSHRLDECKQNEVSYVQTSTNSTIIYLKCDQRYDAVDSVALAHVLRRTNVKRPLTQEAQLDICSNGDFEQQQKENVKCSCEFCRALDCRRTLNPQAMMISKLNSQQPSCVGLSTLIRDHPVEQKVNQMLNEAYSEHSSTVGTRAFPAANYMSRYMETMMQLMSPTGSIENSEKSDRMYDLPANEAMDDDDNFTSISRLDPRKPIRFPQFPFLSPSYPDLQNDIKPGLDSLKSPSPEKYMYEDSQSFHPNSLASTHPSHDFHFDAPINIEPSFFLTGSPQMA